MSMAAACKIIYLHIQHRRLAAITYQAHIAESATSPDMPVSGTFPAELRCPVDRSIPPSLPSAAAQLQYFPSPEKTTGTEIRPGTGRTGGSTASSVLHRRVLHTPNGSTTVANVIIPAIFRDNDEETIDNESLSQERSGVAEWDSWIAAVRCPSDVVDLGYTGTIDAQVNVLERWSSTTTSNSGPPNLPNPFRGIWRLFLFQGIFFSLDFMASLSTAVAWATGRPVPPIASHHIALVLVMWGPAIVFGHAPGVRRQLKASCNLFLQRCRKFIR
ncbi:hypothetical protein HWV62_20017 [Athelia sp. TMB]|nr:hypothetical protein HWV62_20017 [Athelia sp. TMB]